MHALDRATWQALMRTPSQWQHLFGPPHSPVAVIASTEPLLNLVRSLRSLTDARGPRCIVVEGGDGAGKSLATAAFQAACQHEGIDVAALNEGIPADIAVPRANGADAVIVDNLDQCSPGIRKTLFERRHAAPRGTLLTASRLSAVERQLISDDDEFFTLGRFEDRPTDVLILASLHWEDLDLAPPLAELCVEGVGNALALGPWLRGAHSVRRAISVLAEGLSLEGFFDQDPRQISVAEVLSAVLTVVREDQPPEAEDLVVVLVEGTTDVAYLESSAHAAEAEWGIDLLSGCRVEACGTDKEGGATKSVRALARLEAKGVLAIGLFDEDEPGRAAAKDARRLTGHQTYQLPWFFDPLGRRKGEAEVEIEDLLPVALLDEFYREHPDLQPEQETIRGERRRIVIAGPDKERLSEWVRTRASFPDLSKMIYVLCSIRLALGLPLPEQPPVREWMTSIENSGA